MDAKQNNTHASRNIPSATRPTVDGIDGGVAPSGAPGAESDLDLQISYPIIYPQNSIIFQTDDANYASGREGGGGFLNTFLDGIDGSYCTFSDFGETGDASIDPKYPDPLGGFTGQRQCGVFKPTNVISISYGEQEDDLPTNYQQRQCAEFMKLGMQGTSVFIASGDSGVAARGTDDGNADGCLGTTGKVFNPDFPASCPFVSAVGATVLPANGNAAADAETAVTRFPSGGGFSNIYATPSYQSSLVNTYLTSHVPTTYKSYSTSGTNNPSAATTNGGIYNRGGRGYPDFSAIGDNVAIVFNGQSTTIGGTSASSPVFAAIINRVNEERIAVGKAPVGFVNPTLVSLTPNEICTLHHTLTQDTTVRPPRSLPRHHRRQQSRLRYPGLPRVRWLGSSHRLGNAKLPQDLGLVYGPALRALSLVAESGENGGGFMIFIYVCMYGCRDVVVGSGDSCV